ncbi:hypothetical protein SDRG_08210 [Saprolegnia diclina VS20]|uniref:F-box domain-containing protein n=1 Tax=Saprolegnia diclina (strain VS20) TaxID=1156394 RepID=T0QI82_SAPDV|nr:hypothetical protein SDRG_08210 [Saprolegnia diclina VS20]EQC34441.1 hypothetical protein SDRG_08210 [Saprolegnia diclina VS20]|eukprot:XP_008612303.1 hypothetical protein SDRG_08210 [Saprolegnia diclina VS20]
MRAPAESAPWLLPPIVLQVVHCLYAAKDVMAFLHAVPINARDEALNALVALLADANAVPEHLWPLTFADALQSADAATVLRALPALRKLRAREDDHNVTANVFHVMALPPTTPVEAYISDVRNLRETFGLWARNIVTLNIDIEEDPSDQRDLAAALMACPKLEALAIEWFSEINAEQLDTFHARLPKPWQHALRTTSTLGTTKLAFASSVLDALLDPSSPPVPRQLHTLTLSPQDTWVDETYASDKLASSAVSRMTLGYDDCYVTPIMTALPPTLLYLTVSYATMTRFPLLPQLQHLKLEGVTLSSNAVADLTSWLASSPSLLRLDLNHLALPDDQLQSILDILPPWLSRQKSMCCVRLTVTEATAMVLARTIVEMRNTHEMSRVSTKRRSKL